MSAPLSNRDTTVTVSVLVLSQFAARTIRPTAVITHTWHQPKIVGGLVVVAVDGTAGSTEALRWAFDEAVMRGGELEVIQAISPDASVTEISSRQSNVSEMLEDWRSDFPGLAVRIDVTRGDPTPLLIEASANAAVVVTVSANTAGLTPSSCSVDPHQLAIGADAVVLVPAENHSHDLHRDKVQLAV